MVTAVRTSNPTIQSYELRNCITTVTQKSERESQWLPAETAEGRTGCGESAGRDNAMALEKLGMWKN
jgi:hypothetical protein